MSGPFGSLQTTPIDLRFHVLGIPVIVTPWFWLAGLVGGWSPNHPDLVAIWIACLFVSILIHELGHAFTARAFGWPPQVYLYHFGGLAVYHPGYGHTTSRSVLISFAGPAAGFVLFGLVLLLQWAIGVPRSGDWIFPLDIEPGSWFLGLDHASALRLLDAFQQMEWINLWWGIVNLAPVLPLDGGRIAEALLQRARPRDGAILVRRLSAVVAGGLALLLLLHKDEYGTFPALLFGLLCITNIQEMQQTRRSW